MDLSKIQSLFQSIFTPVFLINHGYCTYLNKAAEALLGYDQADIGQRRFNDLIAADPQFVSSVVEELRQRDHWFGQVPFRSQNGGLVQAEIRVIRRTLPDGSAINVTFASAASETALAANAGTAEVIQPRLSPGQMLLLQLLAEGLSDPQVAEVMGITAETFREEVRDLVAVMGVRSRTAAVIRAIKAGVVL